MVKGQAAVLEKQREELVNRLEILECLREGRHHSTQQEIHISLVGTQGQERRGLPKITQAVTDNQRSWAPGTSPCVWSCFSWRWWCGVKDRLMDVFQVPGLLFKAWLVFIELSATLSNQELKSWFSKLHGGQDQMLTFLKNFPLRSCPTVKSLLQIPWKLPFPLKSFSLSDIQIELYKKDANIKPFENNWVGWWVKCTISIFSLKRNEGGFWIALRGTSDHIPLRLSLLNKPPGSMHAGAPPIWVSSLYLKASLSLLLQVCLGYRDTASRLSPPSASSPDSFSWQPSPGSSEQTWCHCSLLISDVTQM